MSAKGIDFDPLAIRQQQLTLGQLANTVATSTLDLQQRRQLIDMMKDPAFAQAYSSMLSGSGGGADFAPLFQKYPMAAGPQFTQLLDSVGKMATIGKTRADADKAKADMRKEQLTVLANAADGLANTPGPLVPDKVITFLRQAHVIGADDLTADVMSAVRSGDEGAVRASLQNFSQAGSSMAQRASANEQNVRAGLAPSEFALKAYDAARQAAQWVGGGEIKQNAAGGFDIIRPNAGAPMPQLPQTVQDTLAKYGVRVVDATAAPQRGADGLFPAGTPAQPVGSVGALQQADAAGVPAAYRPSAGSQAISAPPSPVAAPSGPSGASLPTVQPTGVQAALSPEQTSQAAVRAKTLEESRSTANVAQRALQIIPGLRQELAQGYTGPIAGSEAGRALLNLAVTAGVLKPEQVARVGAMRASDALVTELMGPLARELSTRGSNFAITLVQRSKMGPENALEVAMQMANALQTDARNSISYDRALNQYVTQNPQDYGLSGWQAPAPAKPPPSGKYTAKLPPPSIANLGMRAYGDDGTVYENRKGNAWEIVK